MRNVGAQPPAEPVGWSGGLDLSALFEGRRAALGVPWRTAISANARRARFTDSESAKNVATSGSKTTAMVPWRNRTAYLPRTPPRKSYSLRMGGSALAFFTFSPRCETGTDDAYLVWRVLLHIGSILGLSAAVGQFYCRDAGFISVVTTRATDHCRSSTSTPPERPAPPSFISTAPAPPRRHPLEIGAAQTHRSRHATPPRPRRTRSSPQPAPAQVQRRCAA